MYEFISKIAEGAYGTVWQARHKETSDLVAVKKLKTSPSNKEVRAWALQ